uniref:RRM domain-containing protein n=1 Tax=Glossina brevipalpis TaxID=37001 RepID=A0A1A9WLL7_9MUSC
MSNSTCGSIFEYPSTFYRTFQENGTKYIKSRKILDEKLQHQLNSCAGEIFICGIPRNTKPERIADIASLFGEIYVLRFKVSFSGDSRGFAYLQFLDPNLMIPALNQLPFLFRRFGYPMIRVRQSRNTCQLLLKGIYHRVTPDEVFNTLKQTVQFVKVVCREICRECFEYQVTFSSNEEAIFARRKLLRTATKFGRNAVVVWDDTNQ